MQKLRSLCGSGFEEDLAMETENGFIDSTKIKRLSGFRKYPDRSLKDHLYVQNKKRIIRYGRKKNA